VSKRKKIRHAKQIITDMTLFNRGEFVATNGKEIKTDISAVVRE
jgi:hypothetical protein